MRSISSYIVMAVSSVVLTTAAYANPMGGNVAQGQAGIDQSDALRTIINQTSPRAVINWQSFNIAKNETTSFNQPSVNAVTLNRVVGNNFSTIAGHLTSNKGSVFLVNPSGILFTKTSHVDVASFLATTAEIKDEDFMAGRYHFVQAPGSQATIINEGEIDIAPWGLVALVAPYVRTGNVDVSYTRILLDSIPAEHVFAADFYGDHMIYFAVADDEDIADDKLVKRSDQPTVLTTKDHWFWGREVVVMTDLAQAKKIIDETVNSNGVHQANNATLAEDGVVLDYVPYIPILF